jgi:hypothetical protein
MTTTIIIKSYQKEKVRNIMHMYMCMCQLQPHTQVYKGIVDVLFEGEINRMRRY